MTNAVKASAIAVLNAVLQLVVSFGVTISDGQTAAITSLVNAILLGWVALTYKQSAKRIPD